MYSESEPPVRFLGNTSSGKVRLLISYHLSPVKFQLTPRDDSPAHYPKVNVHGFLVEIKGNNLFLLYYTMVSVPNGQSIR